MTLHLGCEVASGQVEAVPWIVVIRDGVPFLQQGREYPLLLGLLVSVVGRDGLEVEAALAEVSLPLVDALVVEELAVQRVVGVEGALLLDGVAHGDDGVHGVCQHEPDLRHGTLRSLQWIYSINFDANGNTINNLFSFHSHLFCLINPIHDIH